MFNGIADEAMVNDGTGFVHLSMTSFVIRFISYTTTSLGRNFIHCYFLFVFKIPMLFRFQWQCSLECLDFLHRLQITSVHLPLLAFPCLVGGSSNFQYSLVFAIISSRVITAFQP